MHGPRETRPPAELAQAQLCRYPRIFGPCFLPPHRLPAAPASSPPFRPRTPDLLQHPHPLRPDRHSTCVNATRPQHLVHPPASRKSRNPADEPLALILLRVPTVASGCRLPLGVFAPQTSQCESNTVTRGVWTLGVAGNERASAESMANLCFILTLQLSFSQSDLQARPLTPFEYPRDAGRAIDPTRRVQSTDPGAFALVSAGGAVPVPRES